MRAGQPLVALVDKEMRYWSAPIAHVRRWGNGQPPRRGHRAEGHPQVSRREHGFRRASETMPRSRGRKRAGHRARASPGRRLRRARPARPRPARQWPAPAAHRPHRTPAPPRRRPGPSPEPPRRDRAWPRRAFALEEACRGEADARGRAGHEHPAPGQPHARASARRVGRTASATSSQRVAHTREWPRMYLISSSSSVMRDGRPMICGCMARQKYRSSR